MKRPIITEFLGDGIELEEAHEIYKMNPELWSYIQAQDKHIDYVESQLEKEREDVIELKSYLDHSEKELDELNIAHSELIEQNNNTTSNPK